MKKICVYLSFLSSLMVLIAYDKEDNNSATAWQNIPADFDNTNLVLTVNGISQSEQTVKFEATNEETASLYFENAIPDAYKVTIDVKLTWNNNGYDFSGVKNMGGYLIDVTGNVSTSNKMVVNLSATGWTLAQTEYSGEKLDLKINGKPVSNEVVILEKITEAHALLTLNNLDSIGQASMKVGILYLQEMPESTYMFKGTYSFDHPYYYYAIDAEGTLVENEKLTLNVLTEYTSRDVPETSEE